MNRPTLLQALDRTASYHAHQLRRHKRSWDKTHRTADSAAITYLEGYLDALAEIRRLAPDRTRTTYRR